MTEDHNAVNLTGKVSGRPERRPLPSGDEVVAMRLVVRRPQGGADTVPISVGPAPGPGRRPASGQVGRRLLAAAERCAPGERVRVEGQLQRRWWAAGDARRSIVEVRATAVEPLAAAAADDAATEP